MNYIVFDLETTGLDPNKEQITEIGAIKTDENFNELGRFHSYVALDGHILTPFIKQFTGITEKTLENAPSEFEALTKLHDFIDEDSIIVAQYAPFDLSFILKYSNALPKLDPKQFICTKSLTSQVVKGKLPANLGKTCERLGIKLDNAHEAMADSVATLELLKYRQNNNLEDIPYFNNSISKVNKNTYLPTHTKAVLDSKGNLLELR